MTVTTPEQRWVEHHMSTAVTLGGVGIDADAAGRFFERIAGLERLLSRFRPDSEVSRIARGELDVDDADPAVREVLIRCAVLRARTEGDFEHEPRAASGDAQAPVLDPNAVAKGWIVEAALAPLRGPGLEVFANAGGDIATTPRRDGRPWRVGIQHPTEREAILGVVDVIAGAVATSGSYERGPHILRRRPGALTSVTVVGPDLATADALATAAFANGGSPPSWWDAVEPSYGLLTLSEEGRLRWIAPSHGDEFRWRVPAR